MSSEPTSSEKLIAINAQTASAGSPDGVGMMLGERIDLKATYDAQYRDFRISEPYRFFLLVVGSIGCLLASLCYTFGIFAHEVQAMGGFGMTDMASITTSMLVFSFFTLPYAFIFDYFGPKPVLCVGTVMLPLGSLLVGLIFNGSIAPTLTNFCIFVAIMGGGCIVFDIGTVVCVLSWFPVNKGPVVAIMKSFAGLGAAIVGTFQLAFFENDTAGFFFLLMGMALALGTFCIATMVLPPYHLTASQVKNLCQEEKNARHMTKHLFLTQRATVFRMAISFAFVIFLVIFLPVQSILIVYAGVGNGAKIAFACIVITSLVLYPVFALPLPFFGGMDTENMLTAAESDPATIAADLAARTGAKQEHGPCTASGEEAELEEEIVGDLDFTAPQYQTTFAQSLLTFHLWAVFIVCFAVIGAQLVIVLNYMYIVLALGGKAKDKKFFTLLNTIHGVGSAIGRLLLAGFEMWSQNRPAEKRVPITLALFMPVIFTTLGLAFYFLPGEALMVGHFFNAVGNGCAAAAAVLVFNTIFAKEPAKHYNFGFLAAMVSAILFNRVAFAEWYHSQVDILHFPEVINGVCFAKRCVVMPLALMVGINIFAVLCAVYVHWHYSRFCRDVLAQRHAALDEQELFVTEGEPRELLEARREGSNGSGNTDPTKVPAPVVFRKHNSEPN